MRYLRLAWGIVLLMSAMAYAVAGTWAGLSGEGLVEPPGARVALLLLILSGPACVMFLVWMVRWMLDEVFVSRPGSTRAEDVDARIARLINRGVDTSRKRARLARLMALRDQCLRVAPPNGGGSEPIPTAKDVSPEGLFEVLRKLKNSGRAIPPEQAPSTLQWYDEDGERWTAVPNPDVYMMVRESDLAEALQVHDESSDG